LDRPTKGVVITRLDRVNQDRRIKPGDDGIK
jgi:hypothetical protein